AIQRAQKSGSPRLRIQTVDFIADHAAAQLPRAAFLADHESLDQMNSEGLGGLVVQFGEHAPHELERLLGALPGRDDLPAHLYNACFKVKDEAARMKVLERTMALPPPALDAGPHRTAYTMAFNNACVLAHAKKDFQRAKDIADKAQPYAAENPYIF